VVEVRVDVEHARRSVECRSDRLDRRAIAALAEVRDGLEHRHVPTLESVKEYYDRRAAEYDDWYLGKGRFADRDRPGWDDEVEALTRVVGELPPARTLDVACGTGFLTKHLVGDVVALDQSLLMLEEAARQAPHATVVQGDALALPFPDRSFDRVFTAHFY